MDELDCSCIIDRDIKSTTNLLLKNYSNDINIFFFSSSNFEFIDTILNKIFNKIFKKNKHKVYRITFIVRLLTSGINSNIFIHKTKRDRYNKLILEYCLKLMNKIKFFNYNRISDISDTNFLNLIWDKSNIYYRNDNDNVNIFMDLFCNIFKYVENYNIIKNFMFSINNIKNIFTTLMIKKKFNDMLKNINNISKIEKIILDLNIEVNKYVVWKYEYINLIPKLFENDKFVFDKRDIKYIKTNISLNCLKKILEGGYLDEINLSKIIHILKDKNFWDENFDQIIYQFEIFYSILKKLGLNISDSCYEENFGYIIYEFKKHNKHIPLEIINDIDDISWDNYEHLEYTDIPSWMYPYWKKYWWDKIKNNYSKDNYKLFYNEIIHNPNSKEVYYKISNNLL